MILRRVIQHVRAQSWTAIGIDFLIVVLGVFIGLQVSNWNDAQRERVSESHYLAALSADIGKDAERIAAVRAADEARIAAINYTLDKALGEKPPESVRFPYNDDFISQAMPVVDFPSVAPPPESNRDLLWSIVNMTRIVTKNSAAYDALVASGDIDQLHDEALIDALRAYYERISGVRDLEDNTLRPMRNQWVAKGQTFGLSGFGAVEENRFIKLVRDNPELAAILRTARDLSVLHWWIAGNAAADGQTLLKAISETN